MKLASRTLVATLLALWAIAPASFVSLAGCGKADSAKSDDDDAPKKSKKKKKSKGDDDDDAPKKKADDSDSPKKKAKGDDDDDAPKKKLEDGPTVEAKAEHFSIEFPPGYPTPKKQTQELPGTDGIDLVYWTSETADGVCLVGYIDYKDKSLFKGRTPKQAFDGGRDGALKNLGGTLEKEGDFEYQKLPARMFTYAGAKGGKKFFGRQTLILDGIHLYQVMFLGYTKDERDTAAVKGFFGSLHIDS